MLVHRRRSEAEFFKAVAGMADGEQKADAFEDFRNAMFPFIRKEREAEQRKVKQVMDRAFAHGAIKIHAQRPGGGDRR